MSGSHSYKLSGMKVMLSVPESVVKTLDDLAAEAGVSRSALVASLAQREAVERRRRRVANADRLLATAVHHGDATALIREDRHR